MSPAEHASTASSQVPERHRLHTSRLIDGWGGQLITAQAMPGSAAPESTSVRITVNVVAAHPLFKGFVG